MIAVKPEYQQTGINGLLLDSVIRTALKFDMEMAETGPMLELNDKVQTQWKFFDVRQHRRRRVWICKIDDEKLKIKYLGYKHTAKKMRLWAHGYKWGESHGWCLKDTFKTARQINTYIAQRTKETHTVSVMDFLPKSTVSESQKY